MKYRIINPLAVTAKVKVAYLCPNCRVKLQNSISEAGQNDNCPECNVTFIVPGETDLEICKRKENSQTARQRKKNTYQTKVITKVKTPNINGVSSIAEVFLAPANFVDSIVDYLKSAICGLVSSSQIRRVSNIAHGMLFLDLILVSINGAAIATKIGSMKQWGLSVAFVLGIAISQYIAWKALSANQRLITSTTTYIKHTFILDICGVILLLVGSIAAIGGVIIGIENENYFSLVPSIFLGFLLFVMAAIYFNPSSVNAKSKETDAGEEAIGLYSYWLKTFVVIAPHAYFAATIIVCVYSIKIGYSLIYKDMSVNDEADWMASSSLLIAGAIFPFAAYIWFLWSYLLVSVVTKIFDIASGSDKEH